MYRTCKCTCMYCTVHYIMHCTSWKIDHHTKDKTKTNGNKLRTYTIIKVTKEPSHILTTPPIDISSIHFTTQKCKTNGIQTSHVLTNHTTIWTCTSLTSPIGTRGGAVSLINNVTVRSCHGKELQAIDRQQLRGGGSESGNESAILLF